MDRSINGKIDLMIDGWMNQFMGGWNDQMIYELMDGWIGGSMD